MLLLQTRIEFAPRHPIQRRWPPKRSPSPWPPKLTLWRYRDEDSRSPPFLLTSSLPRRPYNDVAWLVERASFSSPFFSFSMGDVSLACLPGSPPLPVPSVLFPFVAFPHPPDLFLSFFVFSQLPSSPPPLSRHCTTCRSLRSTCFTL